MADGVLLLWASGGSCCCCCCCCWLSPSSAWAWRALIPSYCAALCTRCSLESNTWTSGVSLWILTSSLCFCDSWGHKLVTMATSWMIESPPSDFLSVHHHSALQLVSFSTLQWHIVEEVSVLEEMLMSGLVCVHSEIICTCCCCCCGCNDVNPDWLDSLSDSIYWGKAEQLLILSYSYKWKISEDHILYWTWLNSQSLMFTTVMARRSSSVRNESQSLIFCIFTM